MRGENVFSFADAKTIRNILSEKNQADPDRQKHLRNKLRNQLKFYITDFDRSNKGFTENDFNALIWEGKIFIEHIESFGYVLDQCIWLQTCCNIFDTLYDSDDETTELLQQTSHKFFDNLNRILQEYIFLLICKLTDTAKTGKRANMTIQSLNVGLCKTNIMTPEIMDLSCELLCYRKSHIVEARNKIIVHADKQTALENRSMGHHTEEEMHQFFINLQKYMDLVSSAIGVDPSYFSVPDPDGDASDLILFLRHCQLMTD